MTNKNHSLYELIPKPVRPLITKTTIGWVLVALIEAVFYVMLANAIIKQQTPLIILGLAILCIALTTVVARSGYLSGVKVAGTLYEGLEQTLNFAKLSWFNLENQSKINSMATQGVLFLMSVPAHSLQLFVHALCLPIFITIGMVLVLNVQVALVSLLILALTFCLQWIGQKRLLALAQEQEHASETINQATTAFIDNIEQRRSELGMSKSVSQLQDIWLAKQAVANKLAKATAFAVFLSYLSTLLPVIVVLIYALGNDFSAINLLIWVMLIARASAPCESLVIAFLSLTKIKHTLISYQELTHAPSLSEGDIDRIVPPLFPVQVEDVSHGPTLRGINFAINENQRVQLKGPSGSGKTTLFDLLMRFDDPEQGNIQLAGHSLKDYRYACLVDQMAYVPQKPVVFTGTLAENMRLGNQASEQELINIAKQLGLSEVIHRDKAGIHQFVGHNGSMLSGGEKQRVCLARAILKNTEILLLDEVTSALDEATEKEVIEFIKSLNRTIIFSTHKNEDWWQADNVIYL
ncbi:ATP-binding cassette domain-containing protein [Brackiella oedipodis]|uniref:ATP-binding cassette domain-containing protein n=1 Tax=Brackiella oedipodis TaxID=124225 RepID=UPI00048EEEBB|nr:ABC transporter ATP-binding protein [Brackiella oedipodis]